MAREAGVKLKRKLAGVVPNRLGSKKVKKKEEEKESDSCSGEFRVLIIIYEISR